MFVGMRPDEALVTTYPHRSDPIRRPRGIMAVVAATTAMPQNFPLDEYLETRAISQVTATRDLPFLIPHEPASAQST